MLRTVLDYASRGWQIFPLKPQAKEPATRRGFYDATTNPETLRRWFEKFPYNIGIRTGTASGVFVIDIDGDQGVASVREIEAKHGALPTTLISTTGKGKHYWFIADSPIPCSNSKIATNIDIKADNGYVVCPPSVHPTGKFYQWIDPSIPPARAPEWLVQLARKRQTAISEQALANIRRPNFSNGGISNYGHAALESEIAALAGTPPGARNHSLNRCAFRLFQLVAGGELDGGQVIERLIEASHRNGLVKDDGLRSVTATIQSARAGMKYPRSRSGAA